MNPEPPPAIKERPISFSSSMLRAILSGTKTMTRRVITPQPSFPTGEKLPYWNCGWLTPERCPHGKPGDRLWVREAYLGTPDGTIIYKVDMDPNDPDAKPARYGRKNWMPNIYMSRKRARTMLEVLTTGFERLQAITEEDALAEGIDDAWLVHHHTGPPRVLEFKNLWDSLNNDRGYGWNKNPVVWKISFRKL